ncbi:MAG: hypothetical protein JO223_19920 [Hyphomicrobiales bacterium]|nr:hypothetical protein [Hyphomicrobiales bacterium]MBV8441056.1 hypothetical protein [Hyphomicrobiales bacterium]
MYNCNLLIDDLPRTTSSGQGAVPQSAGEFNGLVAAFVSFGGDRRRGVGQGERGCRRVGRFMARRARGSPRSAFEPATAIELADDLHERRQSPRVAAVDQRVDEAQRLGQPRLQMSVSLGRVEPAISEGAVNLALDRLHADLANLDDLLGVNPAANAPKCRSRSAAFSARPRAVCSAASGAPGRRVGVVGHDSCGRRSARTL